MLIKNIKWDTDGDMEALASLPTEVYTPPFLQPLRRESPLRKGWECVKSGTV